MLQAPFSCCSKHVFVWVAPDELMRIYQSVKFFLCKDRTLNNSSKRFIVDNFAACKHTYLKGVETSKSILDRFLLSAAAVALSWACHVVSWNNLLKMIIRDPMTAAGDCHCSYVIVFVSCGSLSRPVVWNERERRRASVT